MEDHEPSDLIPLFNGMIISFINYELQVIIEPKTSEELAHAKFDATYPSNLYQNSARQQVVTQVKNAFLAEPTPGGGLSNYSIPESPNIEEAKLASASIKSSSVVHDNFDGTKPSHAE
jgi:recombination DNA repair RAD52 pathway protein